jgi:signal peptidase II
MKLLPAIALPLYALDQLTKRWVVTNFTPYDDPQPVIDNYFYLCRWHNTGAAFSIGSGNNWFFVVLSLVALAGLLFFHARGAFRDLPSRVGVALLIAGILGNLTDRLLYRHVVDFLLVDLHVPYANPWPAFNVADSCIFIATGCFIFASLRESRKPAAATAD